MERPGSRQGGVKLLSVLIVEGLCAAVEAGLFLLHDLKGQSAFLCFGHVLLHLPVFILTKPILSQPPGRVHRFFTGLYRGLERIIFGAMQRAGNVV